MAGQRFFWKMWDSSNRFNSLFVHAAAATAAAAAAAAAAATAATTGNALSRDRGAPRLQGIRQKRLHVVVEARDGPLPR
jgi:hypothetical protein